MRERAYKLRERSDEIQLVGFKYLSAGQRESGVTQEKGRREGKQRLKLDDS